MSFKNSTAESLSAVAWLVFTSGVLVQDFCFCNSYVQLLLHISVQARQMDFAKGGLNQS